MCRSVSAGDARSFERTVKSTRDLLIAGRIFRLFFAELRWLHFYSLAARAGLRHGITERLAKIAAQCADALDAEAELRTAKTAAAMAAILQKAESERE